MCSDRILSGRSARSLEFQMESEVDFPNVGLQPGSPRPHKWLTSR